MTDYPALVGKVIADKYRVERMLGQGGMGLVYLAQHVDLARPVAVKLIRRELMETETVAERFLLEARAAAKIQSEHVGRVLDVGRLETGEPYIVMEYLHGQDLAAHLEQFGRFESYVAVDLILEACEALAEAHHNQIVHRDLKPENLFLVNQPDGNFLVKVLDFGISKQLGESSQRVLTSPATALGSPQYMSPEQMEGAVVDVRSDIWALGAILFEMVTGRRAFNGETLAQVCVQVLSGNVSPVRSLAPDVPAVLASAIEQCMKQRQEDRFPNVAAFARAIEPFGTERARMSTQRIAAVLGVGVDRTAPRPNLQIDKTQVGTPPHLRITPGAQPASPVSRTEVSTQGAVSASSLKVQVNRSGARLPIFMGMLAVIVVGAGVWAFTRSQIGDARMHTTTPAEAQSALAAMVEAPNDDGTQPVGAVPVPTRETTVVVTPPGVPLAATSAGDAVTTALEATRASSAAPVDGTSGLTVSKAARAAASPRAAARPSKPAPASPARLPSATPAGNANDFGGRE